MHILKEIFLGAFDFWFGVLLTVIFFGLCLACHALYSTVRSLVIQIIRDHHRISREESRNNAQCL